MTDRAKTSEAAPSAAGAAPGAEAGAGVDEFAHIPSPRTRHPLLAAAASLLAFYLVFHVREDLRYALSGGAALDAGEARVTFSPRVTLTGLDNRFVRVRGTPDRESGLELDTKGSWVFTQFFRVLGTGDRLFVHRTESPLPGLEAEDDVFEGRLIRFRDLSFADAIRAYFSGHVTASHFFPPAELQRAIAAGGAAPDTGRVLALRDRAGDAVALGPGDVVALDLARPDEVRVGLPRDRFADEASARAEIEKRGGTVIAGKGLVKVDVPGAVAPGSLALGSGPPPIERWTFVVRFAADRRQAALSELGEIDRRVEIRDARETLKVRVGELGAVDGALVVKVPGAAERAVTLASIAAVRTLFTVRIPDDAYLLIEADHPRDHLPTVFLALAVALFGVMNLAALIRELRR
jgi:hypothetical protein